MTIGSGVIRRTKLSVDSYLPGQVTTGDDLGVRKITTGSDDRRGGRRGNDACPQSRMGCTHPVFHRHKGPACQAVEANTSVPADSLQLFEVT